LQIDAQEFFKVAEKAGGVCAFDIEASGLKGDYNTIWVVSIKPYQEEPVSFTVSPTRPGLDSRVIREARDMLMDYPLWVSFYGKMFDVPLLQSRLLRHGLSPLVKRHHLDLYWVMRSHTLTARRSMAHLSRWLGTEHQKFDLSPSVWNMENPEKDLELLVARCEADVLETEDLYDRVKHLAANVTR